MIGGQLARYYEVRSRQDTRSTSQYFRGYGIVEQPDKISIQQQKYVTKRGNYYTMQGYRALYTVEAVSLKWLHSKQYF